MVADVAGAEAESGSAAHVLAEDEADGLQVAVTSRGNSNVDGVEADGVMPRIVISVVVEMFGSVIGIATPHSTRPFAEYTGIIAPSILL